MARSANPEQDEKPIVIRCRGTRFKEVLPTAGDVKTVVDASKNPKRRNFCLTFVLKPRDEVGANGKQSARHSPPAPGDQLRKFNEIANKIDCEFAYILNEREMTVKFSFKGISSVKKAKARLLQGVEAIGKAAREIEKKVQLGGVKERDRIEIAGRLRMIESKMKKEEEALPTKEPDKDELKKLLSWLSRERHEVFILSYEGEKIPPIEIGPIKTDPIEKDPNLLTVSIARTCADVLKVFGLPTNEQANELKSPDDQHPFAKEDGALWRLCKERLLGAATAMTIRAVDTRNAIIKEGSKWETPGEVETPVKLPNWVNSTEEGGPGS